jgi:ribose transport system substrate-binding protein
MRFSYSKLLLACLAVFLTACSPPKDEGGDAFAQHNKQLQKMDTSDVMAFRPPEEIVRTLGLKKQETRREVVFLQSQGKTSFQTYQRNLLLMLAGRESGWRISPVDAAGDAAQQVLQLREAAARKPSAILLDPLPGPELDVAVAEAVQAGTTIISLGDTVREGVTLVHTPPEAIGTAAATLVVEAMKRKAADEGNNEPGGRLVQLRSTEAEGWSARIATAFESALKAQPGVILVHDAPAEATADHVNRRMEEARRIQQHYDVIFCHGDAIARLASAHASLAQNREETLIIGTGGLPGRHEGLDLLRGAEIDASIARPPLVDLALRILLRKNHDRSFQPKAAYEIPPMAVGPKNYDQAIRTGTYTLPDL